MVLRGQAGRGSTQEGEGEHLSSLCLQFWMTVYLLLKERYTFKKRETPDDCGSHFLTRKKLLHLLPDDGDPVSVRSQSLGAVSWWTGAETEMGGHYVREWLRPEHSLRGDQKGWEAVQTGRRLMHLSNVSSICACVSRKLCENCFKWDGEWTCSKSRSIDGLKWSEMEKVFATTTAANSWKNNKIALKTAIVFDNSKKTVPKC